MDGIVNPSDTETLKTYVVTDDDSSSGYPGSTYLMTQKFEFNWTVIGNMHKVRKMCQHFGLFVIYFKSVQGDSAASST